jgi:hypothetical protein
MSAEAARAPLTNAGTRIHITRRTARWDERPATVADAPDFWSFAAGAANVRRRIRRRPQSDLRGHP